MTLRPPATEQSAEPAAPLRVSRTLLDRMPTQEEARGALDGYWAELPWRWEYEGDLERVARFDQEVSRQQLAASIGVSPAYHRSCILMHSKGALFDRIKFPTGMVLSAYPWLHTLLKTELSKLHGTSRHKANPVGVMVSRRVDCTLANMTAEQALGLAPRAASLQASLDQLHLNAMHYGLIHLDLKPPNIGLLGGRLVLLDWNVAVSNICLARLPRADNQELVFKLIPELTRGIIKEAILAKAPRPALDKQPELPGLLSSLLRW